MTDGIEERARRHAALGDPTRLAVVEALALGDLTPNQLRVATGASSNLLAHHLDVLEAAGLVVRTRSEGDGRRRYVSATVAADRLVVPVSVPDAERVLFVCTRNSARSQLAAALWTARTGRPSSSAGSDPADAVHPAAVAVARRRGLDLGDVRPRGYDAVTRPPTLVVSVCDRAGEAGVPLAAPRLHWSVPDPVPGGRTADAGAAADLLSRRVDRLAAVAT